MKFLWPEMLWLALLLPLLVLLYVWLMRQRKKTALRYASLSLVKEALGKAGAWRRHVPPAILMLAFAAFVVAEFLQGEASVANLARAALNLYDDTVTRRRLEALFVGMASELAADTSAIAADAVATELRVAGVTC